MKTTIGLQKRTTRFLRAAGLMLCLGVVAVGATERAAILEAIRNLENPRNLTRPGPRGELGPYQFRAATWRMHTSLPFAQAIDRETSDRVAEQHYEWLRRGLLAAGMPVSPYNIGLAWNGGLSAAVKRRSPRAAHHYAQRAANLAATMETTVAVADNR